MKTVQLKEGDAIRVELESGETFILTASVFTCLDIRVGDGRRQLLIEPQSMKALTLYSVNSAVVDVMDKAKIMLKYFYGKEEFDRAYESVLSDGVINTFYLEDGVELVFDRSDYMDGWVEDFVFRYEEWGNYTFPDDNSNTVKFLYH